MMEMEKKKKCQNFSASDRALLLKIANNKRQIIECKKTDAVTWRQKEEAWKKIANQYNASTSGTTRTEKQLKYKYEAIKKELKKQHSQYSAHLRGTGGGPYVPPPPPPKTEDEKMLASTISLNIKGLTAPLDSDGIAGISGVINESNKENVDIQTVEDCTNYIEVDWSEGSCQLLQTPVDPQLIGTQPENEIIEDENAIKISEHDYTSCNTPHGSTWQSRRRPIIKKKKCQTSAGAKFEDLAEKKCGLVEIQGQIAREQLLQQKIEHEKRAILLDLQIEEQLLKNKKLKYELEKMK